MFKICCSFMLMTLTFLQCIYFLNWKIFGIHKVTDERLITVPIDNVVYDIKFNVTTTQETISVNPMDYIFFLAFFTLSCLFSYYFEKFQKERDDVLKDSLIV